MTLEESFYEPELTENFTDLQKIEHATGYILNMFKIKTIKETGQILRYEDCVYVPFGDLEIDHITEKLLTSCTIHIKNEVRSKVKCMHLCPITDFDADPNLITVENGILNLETLDFKPHTPNYPSLVLLPRVYTKPKSDNIEENLKDTLFWKFLKASFTVDGVFRKEDFETVLEIIASTIIKRHVDERHFMFLGQGENGKSVFLGYIESMLGKANVSHIPLQDIENDKFMRANLAGKSANIFSDLSYYELKHTGIIKAIASHEGIESQKKHQQGFTLYPFCKLLFSCNRFPKVYDQTQAFFRRWIIVKWDRNFQNDPERIEYLRDKLDFDQEELDLVFSNLVSIASRLKKDGRFTHSKDWKTIQRDWNANADPVDFFDTNYISDSDGNKTKTETYEFYKETMLSRGETPLGIYQFNRAFAQYHEETIISDKTTGDRTKRVWLDIDFKLPKQTTLNEIDSS